MSHTTLTFPYPSWSERLSAGKALRKVVPRSAHRDWSPKGDRPNLVELLEASNQGRIAKLVPIRYSRMLQSPFTFFRGAAIIMAADLATTPITGIQTQVCGDCHLLNFGGFATPERNLIFDLNDFDETFLAPWEWDVKRLVTSIFVAGRSIQLSDQACYDTARSAAQAYRTSMADYAQMRALDVWYSRLDTHLLIEHAPDSETRKHWEQMTHKAYTRTLQQAFQDLTETVNGRPRFIDNPPRLYHLPNPDEYFTDISALFEQYRDTLQEDRQFLLDRYQLIDVAVNVVGVGSVGTHCGVALLLADQHDPLLLQFKEARASVLEPYVSQMPAPHNGQRVVNGQRLMQAASDIFLGWTSNPRGQEFYFRQLRDMKSSIKLNGMSVKGLTGYAEICGCALARAHACGGDPAMISGYLGKSSSFDRAVADFAAAYNRQVECDYHLLIEAVQSGRIQAREQF